ncbi:major histocompatibility complex class I-related gene protein-like [Thunnus maccoyii]|uniref:major histocompatibility complex class I-related gene protein-like n=1 Tax=Thunnus maccoyii TaxID=8240 RepID=UPI001C4C2D04|nr:major histocompatibility complex class I-related gene protein-like [Thunnus maccoyii]
MITDCAEISLWFTAVCVSVSLSGVYIFQVMAGCELDDETEEITSFVQVGYDGEDFSSFDLKTLRWIAYKPEAVIIERKWTSSNTGELKNFLTSLCPQGMYKSLDYGKNSLMRTEFPSVSLLQKTPSSPVSCHATGFYPHRAKMFWRKDGEELHEDVEHGEILPNHDGSFQMSVDLNLSSVTPEDWRRYECVFQLSGAKNDIVTKLDKKVIRTNWGKTGLTIPIITAVAVFIIAAFGVTVYIKKKNVKGYAFLMMLISSLDN